MSPRFAGLLVRLALFAPGMTLAQIQFEQSPEAQLTLEAYGNLTAGSQKVESPPGPQGDSGRFDGAIRLLERVRLRDLPEVGARVVAQSTPESGVGIGEATVLVFGKSGRLEIGKRMGLPDVLTGYAPNPFTFTYAEFGPHSGLSLDPGGGLQTAFLPRGIQSTLNALTYLGFTARLADDESFKVLYVSQRHAGFLAGASFAPNASDPRFQELVQAGLVHEHYWEQNVLRWGGSYSLAHGASLGTAGSVRDLHSLNLGVETTLYDSLSLGLSATYDGNSGLPGSPPASAGSRGASWGVVTSVNYNSGPWTWGAYYQDARGASDNLGGITRLRAYEAGGSYRWNTHMRWYAAWFHYELNDSFSNVTPSLPRGRVILVGVRLAL